MPTLLELLRQNSAAGGLLPTAQRLLQLERDLKSLLPAYIAVACTVCTCQAGVMLLNVNSSALAVKLRHSLPSVIAALGQRGWQVTAIQVRVQHRDMRWAESAAPSVAIKSLPQSALKNWEQLADQLAASPLKDAVTRLLRHHR